MGIFLVWLLSGIAIGAWSRSKGHGFFSAFVIAFLLSPIGAAIVVAMRSPRYRTLRNGTTLGPPVIDPGAPRPMFCAIMIVVITFALVMVLGR